MPPTEICGASLVCEKFKVWSPQATWQTPTWPKGWHLWRFKLKYPWTHNICFFWLCSLSTNWAEFNMLQRYFFILKRLAKNLNICCKKTMRQGWEQNIQWCVFWGLLHHSMSCHWFFHKGLITISSVVLFLSFQFKISNEKCQLILVC